MFTPRKSYTLAREELKGKTEAEAFNELEKAAWELVHKARWASPYNIAYPMGGAKLNGLRRCLLTLKQARKEITK